MIDWQYMQGDPPLSEHQAELREIDGVWTDAGFTVVPVRDWQGPPIPANEIHGVSTDAIWARYRGRGGAGDAAREAVELLVRLWPLFGEAFVSTMVHDAWQAARGPLKVALTALLHHGVEKITVDLADDDTDSSRDDLFEFLADDAPEVDRQVDALVDIALKRATVTERVTTTFDWNSARGRWQPRQKTEETLRTYESLHDSERP